MPCSARFLIPSSTETLLLLVRGYRTQYSQEVSHPSTNQAQPVSFRDQRLGVFTAVRPYALYATIPFRSWGFTWTSCPFLFLACGSWNNSLTDEKRWLHLHKTSQRMVLKHSQYLFKWFQLPAPRPKVFSYPSNYPHFHHCTILCPMAAYQITPC